MNGRFIFSGGFIFRWRGHSTGVASALMGEGMGQKISRSGGGETSIMPLPTRANLVCVVIGLKGGMNYNKVWKIYKRRILQEEALLHR